MSLFTLSFSSFDVEELSLIKYGLEISKEPVSLDNLNAKGGKPGEHEQHQVFICYFLS